MSWRPKTAVVLGAGLGRRMAPLTETLPKPLVPLAGKALIDHVLDRLKDGGVETAVVNVHYLAEELENHLVARQRPRILISDERREMLDTGGGVAKALRWLGKEPFLIHNADSVWIETNGSNLAQMAAAWNDDTMDCLLMLARRDTSLGYDGAGDFDMAGGGLLARRPAGGRAAYVFAGVSIAHPRLFADAPKGRFSLNLLWDKAIGRARLFGVEAGGIWMHVGDPAALELAERQLQSVKGG